VITDSGFRQRPSLGRLLLMGGLGFAGALIFVVVPVLGQLPRKKLGFIPTGFPVRLEFYVALIAFIACCGVCFLVGARRPPGTPLTWGEALVAATFVFGVLLLGYGIVPNEWLKWADNQLLWRPDKLWLAISSHGVEFGNKAAQIGGRGRIVITLQAIRDIFAATIYILMLGAQVALWIAFQKRGQKPAAAAGAVERTSTFGRPLVRV
jgi:hypothetical protein